VRGPGRLHADAAIGEKSLFDSRTYVTRKLQERDARGLAERKFSKTQILELYLNRVYFGSGSYGIEQASLALLRQTRQADERRGSGDDRRSVNRRRGWRRTAISRRQKARQDRHRGYVESLHYAVE